VQLGLYTHVKAMLIGSPLPPVTAGHGAGTVWLRLVHVALFCGTWQLPSLQEQSPLHHDSPLPCGHSAQDAAEWLPQLTVAGAVGVIEGAGVGTSVGAAVGADVGASVGACVGTAPHLHSSWQYSHCSPLQPLHFSCKHASAASRPWTQSGHGMSPHLGQLE
jgi:hypothetical protein